MMHVHKPLVSVIVPAYNEQAHIGECLNAIRNQSFKSFELIFVDGGSSDRTPLIARKYADLITYDKARGPSFARDVGAREARGKYLAFVDADSVPKSNWLEHIVKTLEQGFVGVGGYVKPKSHKLVHKIMYFVSWNLWPRITFFAQLPQFNGSNCAFRKSVYKKIGGFSKKLSFLEDVDIALRTARVGRVAFDPGMIVYTSTRRLEQIGYWSNFLTYLHAWFRYILGKPIKAEYFKSIRH